MSYATYRVQVRAYYGRVIKRLDSALTPSAQMSVHEVRAGPQRMQHFVSGLPTVVHLMQRAHQSPLVSTLVCRTWASSTGQCSSTGTMYGCVAASICW